MAMYALLDVSFVWFIPYHNVNEINRLNKQDGLFIYLNDVL